ncbi:MAG TPA: hypothetical protein VJQ54_04805 [Candidatus Sulfotelmatobacter sp.]|nr:hypothetical protein [Candidatus Sulfotelmatobacter sp.]
MAPEPEPPLVKTIVAQAPITTATPASERKSHTGAVIVGAVVLAGIIIGGIAFFSQQTKQTSNSPLRTLANIPITRTFSANIAQGTYVVVPGRYTYFRFTVPQRSSNVHIDGHFDTAGGSGSDIEAVILNAEEFADWSNNQQTNAYYVSGRLTSDTLDVKLPATTDALTTYYLVFNNAFSVLSKKVVTAEIKLHYDRTL